MFIKKSDFTNFIHDFKYYMGIINEPAKCDRYTYNQKFEYWGVFISIIIMLSSGLVLWFPIFVTQFLPGEIIAAAKIIHTNQAIIVFIITLWHIYNAMFNPAVIPLDKSIFTGYITEDRFLKEHPIEYEKKNLIR
jgi:cytochrome b subunit of formate dehydrogenase